MIYDVKVSTPGRKSLHPQVTAIQAQRIFESYIQDKTDFIIEVSEYACKHRWLSSRHSDSITFKCADCEAAFGLTDAGLSDLFSEMP